MEVESLSRKLLSLAHYHFTITSNTHINKNTMEREVGESGVVWVVVTLGGWWRRRNRRHKHKRRSQSKLREVWPFPSLVPYSSISPTIENHTSTTTSSRNATSLLIHLRGTTSYAHVCMYICMQQLWGFIGSIAGVCTSMASSPQPLL